MRASDRLEGTTSKILVHHKMEMEKKERVPAGLVVVGKKKDSTLVKICGYCESVEDSENKLRSCSRCLLVAYCSKVCQRAHWKNGHKQASRLSGSGMACLVSLILFF
jgi:hypothetical protein